jgi:uncharacterized membrane protein YheB (UPF0754 family)
MNYWLFLIPIISGFIGWFTNWIAIKMLFHPREPKMYLGITIQGIFPKRQQQFAEKLGKLVSKELLSFDEIKKKITSPDNLKHVLPFLEHKIDGFLREKLSDVFPVISMFIGENTINQLKTVFLNELEAMFPGLINAYMDNLETSLDLEKIVTDKVKGFSTDKMEEILIQIMAKEFRFVEILGGIVGFIIGIMQVAITIFSS